MAETAQEFGSAHTEKKLRTVQSYLSAFTTALKKQDFELIYFDACAGSGASTVKRDKNQGRLLEADELTEGSAMRALQIAVPFDRYVLNDTKRKNVRSLATKVHQHFPQLEDRVRILQSDANEALADLCKRTNWRETRAVVFLDPFGLQIKFSTLKALAQTAAVDVWYLVPVHAMSRQVRGDGAVLPDGGLSVDEALGTERWRDTVTVKEEREYDMFGPVEPSVRKVADAPWFEKVAMDQLKTIFAGGVLDVALPLGRGGLHEFSLVFAWANPSQKARDLAERLARAVLK